MGFVIEDHLNDLIRYTEVVVVREEMQAIYDLMLEYRELIFYLHHSGEILVGGDAPPVVTDSDESE